MKKENKIIGTERIVDDVCGISFVKQTIKDPYSKTPRLMYKYYVNTEEVKFWEYSLDERKGEVSVKFTFKQKQSNF